MGEEGAFQQLVLKVGYPQWGEIAVHPHLTHATEINLRWVIDINIKGKTIRFLKANIKEYLHDFGVRKYFLNRT